MKMHHASSRLLLTGVVLVVTMLLCPVAPAQLVLFNPGMESGHDAPVGWSGRFGKVLVTRDTQTFHGGAASLSVQHPAAGSGSAHQMIAVKPGMKLKLGGWMKSADGTKVNFAAQFFDEKFTWNEFTQIRFLEGAQDWQHAGKEIIVPEKASRMAVGLYVEGVGRAWLDDVTLSAEGEKIEIVMPESGPPPPKEPEDARLIPTTPLPGYYKDYPKAWLNFHENHVQRAKQGGIGIVFLGDSITQGWGGAGREHWDRHFAPLNAANFGIGGDQTGNVLWRLKHGTVDGLSPRLVVLMIGVNNLWSGKNTGAEIAGGIRAIVEELRVRLPQTKVLVLGVLPIGASVEDHGRMKVNEINGHAAKLDDGVNVRFADLGPKFLEKNSALLEGAYLDDRLHLTAKGYEVFAKELLPLVTELMK